jgi:hypothetical protein
MRNRRPLWLALSAMLLIALAGCGTRANFSALAGTGGSLSGSGAGSGSGSLTGAGSGTSGSNIATGPSSTGSQAVGSGATAAGAPSGASPSGASPSRTRSLQRGSAGSTSGGTQTGASGSPITVGFVLQDASGASALVGSNVPITSTQRQQQIAEWLVDYINSQGGVAGRKIVPTFETVSVTTQEPQRVADCEAMAQDQHDQAVMDMNEMLEDDVWACFAANHVDFFGLVTGTDQNFMDAHAPYVTTTWMGLNRQMYAMAHGAASAGWFNGTKVGIIMPDTPEAHSDFTNVLAPQLAAVGVTNYDVRYITLTDGSGQTSQTNNAELAFATEGIKRVIFFHDILVYLQFINQAQAEHYYPEYAFPDYEDAAAIAAFYGNNTVNQGAIAVSSSFESVNDSNSSNAKNAGSTVMVRSQQPPAVQHCLDILSAESHVNFYDPSQSQDPDLDSLYYCDELFLFWQAADKVGAGFTSSQLGVGLKALGTSYQSTWQNSTDYAAGNHDGASSYRVGRYDPSCSCFVKITNWIPAPT